MPRLRPALQPRSGPWQHGVRWCPATPTLVLLLLAAAAWLPCGPGADAAGHVLGFRPPSYPECMCSRGPGGVAFDCGFLEPRSALVGAPGPVAGLEDPPCIHRDVWLEPLLPIFSVVLTVYDQEGAPLQACGSGGR